VICRLHWLKWRRDRKECKKRLARLLSGRRLGIVLSDHTDEDGAAIFQQACRMGLEGIVSKRAKRALSIRPVAGLAQESRTQTAVRHREDRW
jgi:hypothetical protein